MTVLAIVSIWILIGALLGLYEVRRGHWHWFWLLGAIGGPLSLPLFRQIERDEQRAVPLELSASTRTPRPGLRVLAGIDGSDEAVEAALRAADLLGSHLADLTLAMVADFEIHETTPGPLSPAEPWDAAQKSTLASAAASLEEWMGFAPGTVLLSGRPATALHTYAADEHFDLVVVGSRGRGLTKRMVGSCATQLTEESSVPVVVMPRQPSTTRAGRAGRTA